MAQRGGWNKGVMEKGMKPSSHRVLNGFSQRHPVAPDLKTEGKAQTVTGDKVAEAHTGPVYFGVYVSPCMYLKSSLFSWPLHFLTLGLNSWGSFIQSSRNVHSFLKLRQLILNHFMISSLFNANTSPHPLTWINTRDPPPPLWFHLKFSSATPKSQTKPTCTHTMTKLLAQHCFLTDYGHYLQQHTSQLVREI